MMVFGLLKPRETVGTILDVDYERLWRDGKRVIVFDLDGTLGLRGASRPSSSVHAFLQGLLGDGFRVGILSNRRRDLDKEMVRSLANLYPTICRAGKPRIRHLLRLVDRLKGSPSESVLVGDRVLTDILAGNRAGLYTIRVQRAA